MGILHGEIEAMGEGQDHLVFPREQNTRLYQDVGPLKPDTTLTYRDPQGKEIHISVREERDLTNKLKGLRSIELWARNHLNKTVLVFLDATRNDGVTFSQTLKDPAPAVVQTSAPAPVKTPPPAKTKPDAASAAQEAFRKALRKR